MELNWNYSPYTAATDTTESLIRMANRIKSRRESTPQSPLTFKRITPGDMREIWPMLQRETGRTTDFSYGGVLMWVDFFKYEYALYQDTLFIKGTVESDLSKCAFSLPIGSLPLSESVGLLRDYCKSNGLDLEFSAIPEYALEEFGKLSPRCIEPLDDWGDYLYEAEQLAFLKGKKMSKKRNHVNKFVSLYPDWRLEQLTPANAPEAMAFMDRFDAEGDSTDMAVAERKLSRAMIAEMSNGDSVLKGAILYAEGKVCAYTIGDIKGDTLFIHVEKATRKTEGSYEMVNAMFARHIMENYPEIRFINREDDAGDMGLRMAKESYHPHSILKKYNILF